MAYTATPQSSKAAKPVKQHQEREFGGVVNNQLEMVLMG